MKIAERERALTDGVWFLGILVGAGRGGGTSASGGGFYQDETSEVAGTAGLTQDWSLSSARDCKTLLLVLWWNKMEGTAAGIFPTTDLRCRQIDRTVINAASPEGKNIGRLEGKESHSPSSALPCSHPTVCSLSETAVHSPT